MKIIIINGSNRKDGATSTVVTHIYKQLIKHADVEVQIYHVSDLDLRYCIGCCKCYSIGKCIYHDAIENLSIAIEQADGIILGSPTYASNISAQLKTIIDRGHFVIEQLLYGKYAIVVATYENYGGKDTLKILNKLVSFSGASISGQILWKRPFSTAPLRDARFQKSIEKKADRLIRDIASKHRYVFQKIKHAVIFHMGIHPFVKKKKEDYKGVIERWENHK